MPTPRRSSRLLAEMISEPMKALKDQKFWTVSLCLRWLDHVDLAALFNPSTALSLAVIGVRLAKRVVRRRRQKRRIRDSCILARAYGSLGSVCRMLGKFDDATKWLTKALEIAQSCTDSDTLSDIHRRWSILHLFVAQRPDASFTPSGLRAATEHAVTALAEGRGGLSIARATIANGLVKVHSGNATGAAQDARAALGILDPTDRPYDHASALSLLVYALLQGDQADREAAPQYLTQLRQMLPPRSPALRARLVWAEALLYIPNLRRKARARRLLDQARRTFVRLGMKAEAVAVTAELTRIKPEGAVPQFCSELSAILEHGPIKALVEQLHSASFADRVAFASRLRDAVQAPGILPAAA